VIPPSDNLFRTARARIAFFAVLFVVGTMLPALAADRSRIVIHAVVLSVDPVKSLVALHQEALETQPAVYRICRLKNPGDLRLLQRGTVIEATAETAHDPWVLDAVRVRARTVFPSSTAPAAI
jgi:hypothetical protein